MTLGKSNPPFFYKQLYTSHGTDPDSQNLFLNQSVPQLDQQCSGTCDEDISIEELGKALKSLPNGKTPGSDGFNTDFYKFFWASIKQPLFESVNYSLEKGELTCEQRRGIITLIPKKDKDTRLLKNWRPISLLNTDYKNGRPQSIRRCGPLEQVFKPVHTL